MVDARAAAAIVEHLFQAGIHVWLTGGWGIDALLGVQTRPHKDLDLILRIDDVAPMQELLAEDGFHDLELWSENCWVQGVNGERLPTAFVLGHRDGRQVDAHAIRLDENGNGIPAWVNEDRLAFSEADLAARGTIGGSHVRCIAPSMQVVCHSGYLMPDFQTRDMILLGERFDLG